jgi:two-component system, OmpR family, phosphate regulon response regulator PhoB
LRSIVCRYTTQAELRRVIEGADHELSVPQGEEVTDGEWLLAIVEVGRARRATAAAARAVVHEDGASFLLFEPRDWQRIAELSQERGTQPPPDEAPTTDRSPTSSRRGGRTSAIPRQVVAAPANARVLLVDDDEGIRDVVGAMLEAVGLVVTSVASGEHARTSLADAKFDLVVLDWTLPGIGGLELCREIRKNTHTPDIPVLFLTANASSKDMVAAFAAGADDYVVKPFRAPELGARIFGLLRRARIVSAT